MNILFVTLEESGKKISVKILDELSIQKINHNYYTFGLDSNYASNIRDISNIKIKPLMGFLEIIKNIRYIYKLRSHLIFQIHKFDIRHIFFVDSFDFSKFFFKKFNKVKCSQIVGPSVFIWNKKKANYINNNFEKLFSIFLADKPYYDHNTYSYIGHPLSSNIVSRNLKFDSIKNIGIFLGSRDQEFFNNFKTISIFIDKYGSNFNFIFFTLPKYKKFIHDHYFQNANVEVNINDNNYYKNISNIDFAFACSGTVHLELSLTKIPHLIFYKTNFLNLFFFKIFIKIKFISLLNIFSNKEIVKEFINNDFNPKSINSYLCSINNKKKLNSLSNDLNLNIKINNINFFDIKPIIDYLKKFS